MDNVTSLDVHRLKTQGKLSQEAATDIILHQDAELKELRELNEQLIQTIADQSSKINVLAPIAVALMARQWEHPEGLPKASEYGSTFQTAVLLNALSNYHLDLEVNNETQRTVIKATRKASRDGNQTEALPEGEQRERTTNSPS
ncbi:MAG: hypothetical protein K2W95_01025 [Candidatus Obscuribacterales bacterium]|nr:hypothetical protein [Candidatus Obscuribacterales bacterium]